MDEPGTADTVKLRPGVSIGKLAVDQFIITSVERTLKIAPSGGSMNRLLETIARGGNAAVQKNMGTREKDQLQWLIAEGFLVNANPTLTEEDSTIDYLENYLPLYERTAANYKVVVDGDNPIAEKLRQLLTGASQGSKEVLRVCTSHVGDDDELLSANKRYIEAGEKSIFVSTMGPRIRIGPFVIPRETACYACFVKRAELVTTNPGLVDVAQRARTISLYSSPPSHIVTTLAAGIAAAAILRAITAIGGSFWAGKILQMSAIDLSSQTAAVLKVPRCSACGKATSGRTTYAPSM